MKQYLTIILTLFCGFCNGQRFSKCEVYQFAGTNGSKKSIVLKQTFNAFGQLTSEIYSNYKSNSAEARSDGTNFYFYKDTLLVKRTFVDRSKDSTKMLCYYDSKNKLIRQEHFTFKRRVRKDVDKGLGRPGGCILTDEDYEKNRTWEQISEVSYSYDSNGRKTLYDATKLHYSSQNKYIWTYDSQGRLMKYSSYDGERLIWIKEYSYFKEGYRFTMTWYDYDGNPQNLKTNSSEYIPQYTTTYFLDDKGRVFKEVTTTDKGETVSTETTTYNAVGQIAQTVYFDGEGLPEITHIYVYH